jgi:hypothetical protein
MTKRIRNGCWGQHTERGSSGTSEGPVKNRTH